MIVCIPDKIIAKYIEGKDYIMCADEGEAIAIAVGYYYATKEAADVYISADGFMNALNPLTSLVIPEKIAMKIYISIGRKEAQHKVATEVVPSIVRILKKYATARVDYKFIEKE